MYQSLLLVIFSIVKPFASSSTSLSSILRSRIIGSSMVSSCTPQTFSLASSRAGFIPVEEQLTVSGLQI